MKRTIADFKVFSNRKLPGSYFVLTLQSPNKILPVLPGQFAQVLVEGSPSTYLRRPFSIYHINEAESQISLLIKTVGRGSEALSQLTTNQIVNMIYPLGNSFSVRDGDRMLLVGGGVGIAPMLMLAKKLKEADKKVDVLIGGRSSADIVEPELYKEFGNVLITTDDGSAGEKGKVTDHPIFFSKFTYNAIYACGPDPMMKAVASIAHKNGVYCEVSLENLMACGFGACLCCIAETSEGNKTTCLEGPVFNSRTLTGWE